MTKKILWITLAIVIVLSTTACFKVVLSNRLKIENKKFYLPDYMVEVEDINGKSYFLITAAFDSFFSPERFYSTHWWDGIVGLYIVIENEKVIDTLIRLEYNGQQKTLIPDDFYYSYNGTSLTDIIALVEDESKLALFIGKINLSNAIDSGIESSFKSLKYEISKTDL